MANYNIRYLSLEGYVVRTIFLTLTMLGLFNVMGTEDNTTASFISESVVFLILTFIAAKLYLGNNSIVYIFLLAYVIKLLIGVFHYLYFIDPNYFHSTGNNQMLHQEFQAVTQFLESAVAEKKELGLFHMKLDGYVTHQEILSIIAIPFRYFGVKILNIAPINSFFSILTAINIFMVCKKEEWTSDVCKCILLILAFFPATLLTSYFFRDIVGWAFISVGLVLICKANSITTKTIAIVISMGLFYLQRNGYIVIPIALVMAQYSLLAKTRKVGMFLFVCIVALLIVPLAVGFASTESTDSYVDGVSNLTVIALPIKIILGLIGPFPWTNVMMYETFPAVSYYIGDYVMGCLNIGLLICLFTNWRQYKRIGSLTESMILGLLLISTGLLTRVMHMTYISIGVIFMIPWFVENVGYVAINQNIRKAVIVLVLLNILVVSLGLGGLGTIFR